VVGRRQLGPRGRVIHVHVHVEERIAIGVGGAGFSTTALNPTAVAAGAQGQLRVYGLGRDVAVPAGSAVNAWNDAYTIVQVQIANNSFTANKTAP
ncbi:MAG: hypothetical protein EBT89_12040, partial [Opitutaceae bacterium]|nr:hypothetical protein [Opitutaceae bacterium]